MAELPTPTTVFMATLIGKALIEDGINQAQFARVVGVSEKHLSNVLNGKADARPATLDYWAFVLRRCWRISLEPMKGDEKTP